MESLGNDTIAILQYLLPGFLAAWVFYGLTSYPVPSQFERVVQALIFTLIINALVYLEKLLLAQSGGGLADVREDEARLAAATLTAFAVGTVFSYGANSDLFHALARGCGITRETSYSSEWFGAFSKNITYVVLHLKDERRLYGWPRVWPSDPKEGHFLLEEASWLFDKSEESLSRVSCILVSVEDVKWVEFMKDTWEKTR